jgi:hypothetical protein
MATDASDGTFPSAWPVRRGGGLRQNLLYFVRRIGDGTNAPGGQMHRRRLILLLAVARPKRKPRLPPKVWRQRSFRKAEGGDVARRST